MDIKLILVLTLATSAMSDVPEWYARKRQAFIDEELAMRVGADLVLNEKETLVNEFIMAEKIKLVNETTFTTKPYPAAVHFFESKQWIDESVIFEVIKMMPKGGVLHAHSHAIVSLEWVIKTFTYAPNCWTKMLDDAYYSRVYSFQDDQPGPEWSLVNDLRDAAPDADKFDQELMVNMSIWTDDPYYAYPTVNDVWGKFQTYFIQSGGFGDSLERETMYIKQAIKEFYEDGVQYMELRAGTVDNEQGEDISDDYYQMIRDAVAEFQEEHPDFIGVKAIISGKRSASLTKQDRKIDRAVELMKDFPDIVKGFDLVQQEDVTHTTLYYINDLVENHHSIAPFFFHAGETDWTQGVDMNLIDSVLLNASRIGHGYAALKHPLVMKAILRGDIAVELNPISNQVLGLVTDLRDHPGSVLLSYGAPTVVCSDDPVVWFATPLSHDFYMAFMGLGAVHDDLRLMKKLAMNSLEYSTMVADEQVVALQKWSGAWDQFIDKVIEKYNLA